MFEKYYKRIRFLMHNPFWAWYLNWAYKKGFEDLNEVKRNPNFLNKDFTALLCGTAGSTTSKTFAKYIFLKNPKARLIILDLGKDQLNDSKRELSLMFPGKNIVYLCENAIKTSIKKKAIDYIETDGLFEFFSYSDLNKLLKEWDRILKDKGFITFRAYASGSFFTNIFDNLKVFMGDKLFFVNVYAHRKDELIRILDRSRFKWNNSGKTFLPGFLRFVAYK